MGMRDFFAGLSRVGQLEPAGLAAYDLDVDGSHSVLVAVDGHAPSLRAAAYAVGLARRQGVRLVVLYVHTMSPLASTTDSIHAMRGANAAAVEGLRAEMDRQATELGVDIAVFERHGSPYAETMRLAAQLRVDAVVMTRGRNFGHHLFGSRLERIARDARCPVTVVP